MYPIDSQFYSPSLREKAGELRALRSLSHVSKDYVLPILLALPLSEKENRNLTRNALVKREVGRVQHNWGSRICLWDSQLLRFDSEDAAKDAAWLRRLLHEFSAFGTRIIPVIGLREQVHRASVLTAHSRAVGSGVALRLDFDDIQDFELLDASLSSLRVEPEECILVVDITGADISAHDEFARSLVGWLYTLKSFRNWRKIIVVGSSFPIKNPAPPMGDAMSPRQEWRLWKWTIGLDPALREFVIFGDYGADNAFFRFKSGGRPIPHLRYASELDWLTARGDDTYASLRGVSKRIVSSSHFRGREFSEGDRFIVECSNGGAVSDPTAWRAANMNHHMTVAVLGLADLYGLELPDTRIVRVTQRELFEVVGG